MNAATIQPTTPERTPLYGHTSPETAYLVPDYPYGRKVRCRIRYWLERNDRHGFRLVSQTEDPRRLIWNKPKASTYCDFAGAMYLDENGHVQWTGLGPHSSEETTLSFVKEFPGADLSLLRPFAAAKCVLYRKVADSGKAMFRINGQEPEPLSAEDIARYRSEAAIWESVANIGR